MCCLSMLDVEGMSCQGLVFVVGGLVLFCCGGVFLTLVFGRRRPGMCVLLKEGVVGV